MSRRGFPHQSKTSAQRRLCLICAVIGAIIGTPSYLSAEGNSDAPRARQQLDSQFQQRLADLASKCDELGLTEQAKITRDWFIARDPSRQYIFLPPLVDPHQPAAGAEQLVAFWRAKFAERRAAQADGLFELARQALDSGDAAGAYQLLHEALRENPDHEQAQQIVYGSPSRARREIVRPKVRTPSVRHDQFGWAPRRYWVVETEHYRIFTDHGGDEGARLAQRLEGLYDVWKQVFFDYWASPQALADRFAGGKTPLGRSQRHKVVLFRDRDEYVSLFAKSQPQIDVTLGIYLDQNATAYFYAGDPAAETTWLHEASHQLFYEMGDAARDVGADGNFWVVEGVALYMESLQPGSGYCTLGGLDADRLQFARYRAANEQFYLPLAQLLSIDRQSLQQHKDIRRLYSQAAGLAHFFMHYDQGRYRPALIEYVHLAHQGRDDRSTLAALAKTEYDELDQQYHRFLNVTDDDLARLPDVRTVRNLSLGHTSVTDKGMVRLAGAVNLQWLDLAHASVSDAGIACLKDAQALTQLNLEHTKATPAALEVVASFSNLEELDLSGLPITDTDLQKLAGLKKLKILWLTGTKVTDAGLAHLYGLSNLEMLDLGQTRVTPQGLAGLKQALPKLNQTEE